MTAKTIVMVGGGVLFVVLLGVFLWSLTRPPVTHGPMPDYPPEPDFAVRDAGRG